MNTLKNINGALMVAYRAAHSDAPPATEYPAKDFVRPNGQPWARVLNFPALKNVNSLGTSGFDLVTGFFQVDYFVPENSGTKQIHEYADKTLDYFTNGRRFNYGGQEVRIIRSSLTPIRRDADTASFRTTVTIYWDAPSQR